MGLLMCLACPLLHCLPLPCQFALLIIAPAE